MRTQLHNPVLDLSWVPSAARQKIQLWQPCSTALFLISPGFRQQQDNPSSYESPAPQPCSWSLLGSVSSKTIHPAMTALLHSPVPDLSWVPSAARQSIQLWQPCSTALFLISPGFRQSTTKNPAMTALLHSPVPDLSWVPSAARQSIQLWQPCSTALFLISPGFRQQHDKKSSYDSPAPQPCSWSLLGSVSSTTKNPAMTALLHSPVPDLSWVPSAARQSIQLWQPCSTALFLISPGFRQQHDKKSSYDSPAPQPCSWSLLGSVSSKTIHPAMTALLHSPVPDLSWVPSAARQKIQLWQPCSTALFLISPGFRQQQDNPSSYDSPAPQPCSWSLLGSVSSTTKNPAMTALLHSLVPDLSWVPSAARQSIQLWQPCSTALFLISPGFRQQHDKKSSYDSPAPQPCSWSLLGSVSSKTIHPAMKALLHNPVLDLSWVPSTARQKIQLWEPSFTTLFLISPGFRQQQDNPSSYENPAPQPCSWSLLGSVSSTTNHPAMTALLHNPVLDLSWVPSAARQSIQLWKPCSTTLFLISPLLGSVSSKTIHPAMTAQLHNPVLDLSWVPSAARQTIQLWQPCSTTLFLISPALLRPSAGSPLQDGSRIVLHVSLDWPFHSYQLSTSITESGAEQ